MWPLRSPLRSPLHSPLHPPSASSDTESSLFVSQTSSPPLFTIHSSPRPDNLVPSAADAAPLTTDIMSCVKHKSEIINKVPTPQSYTSSSPSSRARLDSDAVPMKTTAMGSVKRKLDAIDEASIFQLSAFSLRPTKLARLDSDAPVKRKSDAMDEASLFEVSTSSPRPLKCARLDSGTSSSKTDTKIRVKRKSDVTDELSIPLSSIPSPPLKRARPGSGPSVRVRRPSILAFAKRKFDQSQQAQSPDTPLPSKKAKFLTPAEKERQIRLNIHDAQLAGWIQMNIRKSRNANNGMLTDQVRHLLYKELSHDLNVYKMVTPASTAPAPSSCVTKETAQPPITSPTPSTPSASGGQGQTRASATTTESATQTLVSYENATDSTRPKLFTPATVITTATQTETGYTAPYTVSSTQTEPLAPIATASTTTQTQADYEVHNFIPGSHDQSSAPATTPTVATSTVATQTQVVHEAHISTPYLQDRSSAPVTTPNVATPPVATQTQVDNAAHSYIPHSQDQSSAPITTPIVATQTQADHEAYSSITYSQDQSSAPVTAPTVAAQAETVLEAFGQVPRSQTESCTTTATTATAVEGETDFEGPSFSSDTLAGSDVAMAEALGDTSATTLSSVDDLFDMSAWFVDKACQDDRHSTLFESMDKMEQASAQHAPTPTAPKNPFEEIRGRPLVDDATVQLVQCRLRPETTKTQPAKRKAMKSPFIIDDDSDNNVSSMPQNTSQPQPSQNNNVIDLCDSDDEDSMTTKPGGTSEASSSRPASRSSTSSSGVANEYGFYGLNSNRESEARIRSRLRFQMTKTAGPNEHPSPGVGLRLHDRKYMKDIGATHNPLPQVKRTLKETSRHFGIPEEHGAMAEWTRPGTYTVQAGFPLVEDVDFVVPYNRGDPTGDCYWRSIAFCLYDSPAHWAYVKAEHLAYLHHVLQQPRHARHGLYKDRLNARFFETSAAGLPAFQANLWQMLHLPHTWTPALVSQVTADLYNICIVTFTLEDNVVTETSVRGVYNSRHIFLTFSHGNHFRPMTPNAYPAWEFQYPRVTPEATAKYANAPKASSPKPLTEHPWRREFSPAVLPPVPRLHGCDTVKIGRLLSNDLYSA